MSMSVSHFLSIFCPLSRIWPPSVHFLSPFWLNCVLVLFLTIFGPQHSYFCPFLLQFLSSVSHFCPLFVLISDINLGKKSPDRIRSKIGLNIFLIYNLVTLKLDKPWTISRQYEILTLSSFCPRTTSCSKWLKYQFSMLGQKLDNHWSKSSHSP